LLGAASAQTLQVLYSFCAQKNCTDGNTPQSKLVSDQKGNLYGTTTAGGVQNENVCVPGNGGGCGVAFKLTPEGKQTVLHRFCSQTSCRDGAVPSSGLVFDQKGNLYGTTQGGGSATVCHNGYGCGVLFKLTSNGKETVLHSFCSQKNCTDGEVPFGELIFDKDGNLYGMAFEGGAKGSTYGAGLVFKVTPKGQYSVLYSFCALANCADGAFPSGGVVFDQRGNLYGTTGSGGANQQGVVFKLTPKGKETVLYSFCAEANCADGKDPEAGVVFDGQGNLYGTTPGGGSHCPVGGGCGVAFKISAQGQYSVLHKFFGTGGSLPNAGVILDGKGNLYGPALRGGANKNGVVFKLTPTGKETVLYSFCAQTKCADGADPAGGLVFDENGNVYGTTIGGGIHGPGLAGVVYKITP
jgi:uncharacterized repeat protein (TIGR03803 family)